MKGCRLFVSSPPPFATLPRSYREMWHSFQLSERERWALIRPAGSPPRRCDFAKWRETRAFEKLRRWIARYYSSGRNARGGLSVDENTRAFHSFPSLIAGHNCIRVPEWIENHFSFCILAHDKRGYAIRCRALYITGSTHVYIFYRKIYFVKKRWYPELKFFPIWPINSHLFFGAIGINMT